MLVSQNGTPGAISSWTNNSRIQQDVPEIVLEAESWIYRRLRHWLMLTTPITGNMTIGQPYIPVPGDCLEPYFMQFTGIYQQVIPQITPTNLLMSWTYGPDGTRIQQQPQWYSFDQTNLNFDSPPDQAYGYVWMYFQQPQPLAVTGTNFLTQRYPRLVRCACMAAACEWLKDFGQGAADKGYWDQLAEAEIQQAQFEADRARRAEQVTPRIVGGEGSGMSWMPPFGSVW